MPKPLRKSNRPTGARPDKYRDRIAQARAAVAQGMTWQEAAALYRIPPSQQGRIGPDRNAP